MLLSCGRGARRPSTDSRASAHCRQPTTIEPIARSAARRRLEERGWCASWQAGGSAAGYGRNERMPERDRGAELVIDRGARCRRSASSAEQMAEDAVIFSGKAFSVGNGGNAVLRRIVDNDNRLTVRIVPLIVVQHRLERYEREDRDQSAGNHRTPGTHELLRHDTVPTR